MTTLPTTPDLAALPEPFDHIHTLENTGDTDDVPVYTAEQMREYGRACSLAAPLPPQSPAELTFDEATAGYKLVLVPDEAAPVPLLGEAWLREHAPERVSEYLRVRRWIAHKAEASATGAARDWSKIEKFTDEFIEEYEMRGESEDGRDACYTPNENDRALLRDCIAGLLAEEEFISMLAAPTAPAPQPAQLFSPSRQGNEPPAPVDDAALIAVLESEGVTFHRVYNPGRKTWFESTAGSTEMSKLVAAMRRVLAAPAEPPQASGLTDINYFRAAIRYILAATKEKP